VFGVPTTEINQILVVDRLSPLSAPRTNNGVNYYLPSAIGCCVT